MSVSPASAASSITTKLPSRRDTRRAHRHVAEAPIPRPSTFRRRSGGTSPTPTLPEVFRAISGTSQTPSTTGSHARVGYQRSVSLTEDKIMSGAKLAHRIDLRSISSSDSTLSPPSTKTPPITNNDVLSSPPLHRAPSPPPPALPPRVPLRPTRTGPKHRHHLPAKQRSMSEAHQLLQTVRSVDVPLPRRTARSTSETVESRSSEEVTATDDVVLELDSTLDSNDSVFAASPPCNDDKQVSS